MSKKDYEAIAAAIRTQAVRFDDEEAARHAISETAHAIASVLAGDNHRFNRDRFLTACGVES